MAQNTFVSIANAIDEVGGKPHDLVEALKVGLVHARGRLILEGDDRAAEHTAIPVTDWLDYKFDLNELNLSDVETDVSGAYTQLKYVDIQILRADLKNLIPRKKPAAKKGKPVVKPGQRPHPAKAAIMAELARWERAGQPTFKNRSELGRELTKWYEEAHGADTGPDISNVLAWLRKDREDTRWLVLVRGG